MSNIYNLIKLEYEKKRLNNYHQQQENLDRVYSKVPEIKNIDYKIKRAGIRYNLNILNDNKNTKSIIDLKNYISMLEDKKKQLLLANNFTSDCLTLKYDCLKCHDTGVTEDGLLCPCFRQRLLDYTFGQYNLSILKEENFTTFNELYYSDKISARKGISPRQNILNVKKVAMSFIENFDKAETKNLLFTGNTGVGKTFMLNCIAYELLSMSKTVLYKTAFELFDTINQYKLNSYSDFDDYNRIFNMDLLIIDDLGSEPQSASKHSEILNILNKRQLKNLKTIISTNFSLNKIYQDYRERIFSRIIGNFEILELFGDDIRTIKEK